MTRSGRLAIVCHAWDEESVCLVVQGRKEWHRIHPCGQGPYVVVHGKPYLLGTGEAYSFPQQPLSCEFCPAAGGGCIVCDPSKRAE